jgi:mannose-6-phosphate isomerase-like protein (cupin superfamily)
MPSIERVLIINVNDSPDYQKLLEGEPQTLGMRAGKVYLRPGRTCGEHTTGSHEEMLVFLSGHGQLLIGEDESLPVGKGKVCYIPPNTTHDVKNPGSEPLIYIYCVAPASGRFRR